MATNKKSENGPAVAKRAKISKAKQSMMIITLVGALTVGVCVVLIIHFFKYIQFYGKVINKKDDAITAYEKTITSIGLCPKPKGEHYTDEELSKCNPNSYTPSSGTLRSNVTDVMAYNTDLESVARDAGADVCYDDSGNKINYQELLKTVSDEEERARYLSLLKVCSSLRVIPDALPGGKNVEALLASLNQIFVISGWEPESLAPSEGAEKASIDGVEAIPVTLSIESTPENTMKVLTNIEKSIRTFDIMNAAIEWAGDERLTLQAQANAYYAKDSGVVESDVVEYATKEAKKKASGK